MEREWNAPKDLTEEEAIVEAKRCLSCKNPLCQKGCPTNMRIRDFIFELKQNHIEEAAKIIAECSSLSPICSLVCPHENQCVGHCVLNHKNQPIPIGKLERYVQTREKIIKEKQEKKSYKIAVIGAGPAGLSAAKELLSYGFSVDIYEQEAVAGGVMTYGIPSYRLGYKEVVQIVEEVKELGANFYFGKKMMESDILKLKESYDYVFVAIGLTKVRKLGIPNENLLQVMDALDFLKKVNYAVKLNQGSLPKLYGTVLVVGAGNVAMDAARSAVRLGAEKVMIVYRRSLEEAPATRHEIAEAQAEGVEFRFLTNPVAVIGEDCVTAMKCEIMELGEADASGRRKPIGTQQYVEIPCQFIISAIGQIPENIFDAKILKTDYNYICAENLKTNIDGIYTGGDIHLGAKTVVEAMRCGREFARMVLYNYQKGVN